ncbi:MAG: hypothetical protein PHU02_01230 [Bacilli bacterium]|jgi:hypothetical protein|nr:hypothetical protein [Bacilli bacterium]MDD2682401.1 hypothetical protein [Bacilli bacterium]MDD3121294.1 hypothetical protein [Bacilli bacterium]MDD4063455.1 hypothetical protein [Bacilli bacterium]MDD4482116.1 hypothetical protein [Bacilli bacterium]
MKIKEYFSNNFETSEDHELESLRTRYYRARNEEVKEVAYDLIKQEKGSITDNIPQFSELIFNTSTYSATFTIVSPRISETAVDIKITTYYTIAAGRGKKIIERLYKYFDTQLPFKGVSLYRGL